MPRLELGPLVRHVGTDHATVWVETDAPCEVEVLGRRSRTFHVAGHHYAIVSVEGLDSPDPHPYEVSLDGTRVWPEEGGAFPPSSIRPVRSDRRLRILFGSCRVAAPHAPPFTLDADDSEQGHEVDALWAFTRRMARAPESEWPDAILLVGDQVYADEVSPETFARINATRDTSRPPGEEIANFEEYTWLYHESWRDPVVRWFLSCVPSAMLFDDHDVHDDWNISWSWVEEMRRKPWWEDRIVGAFASYWIYQHLGNLSPHELAEDELLAAIRETDDGWPLLREFALASDRRTSGKRWSFHRDFGRTRLIAIDCRAGRVLTEDRRSLVDDEEWAWIVEQANGDFDHLLLAMSDPWLLPQGIHELQAWDEAVCEGAWGDRAARGAERIRRSLDLDHWASFQSSFQDLSELLAEVAAGRRGEAPGSIVALSGDVHNAFLAEVAFRRETGAVSPVYQAVCSPYRNPLGSKERRAQRFGKTKAAHAIGALLARLAGVGPPPIRWRFLQGQYFQNQIGVLDLDGRRAAMRLEQVGPWDGEGDPPELETVFERTLAR